MAAVAGATPDGYTMGLGGFGQLIIPQLFTKFAWDPVTSFSHVSLVNDTPLFLIVSRDSGIGSMGDFLGRVKAAPGKLNYGTQGVGTSTHLAFELFKQKANLNIVGVPFKGEV
jgi:tripartite-type tricarboxylate transporter receptor subunit TctC